MVFLLEVIVGIYIGMLGLQESGRLQNTQTYNITRCFLNKVFAVIGCRVGPNLIKESSETHLLGVTPYYQGHSFSYLNSSVTTCLGDLD